MYLVTQKGIRQSSFLALLFCIIVSPVFGQNKISHFPWTADQVIEPAVLASEIKSDSANNILILNTGPVDDIKGAVNIGAVEEKKNIRKLKRFLKDIPKDQAIVFYCGCCNMQTCPNIVPAFNLLKKEGFTHFKILDIKENLSEEWISKGYPMPGTKNFVEK
jgi:hypothetical protein